MPRFVLLRQQGKFDEALACYQEAIRLKPDHAAAHVNLGVVMWKKGLLDADSERAARAKLRALLGPHRVRKNHIARRHCASGGIKQLPVVGCDVLVFYQSRHIHAS